MSKYYPSFQLCIFFIINCQCPPSQIENVFEVKSKIFRHSIIELNKQSLRFESVFCLIIKHCGWVAIPISVTFCIFSGKLRNQMQRDRMDMVIVACALFVHAINTVILVEN